MTRGNQREKAREKNLKKQAEQKKGKTGENAGQTLTTRKERDAQIMREKQLAKEAKAAAGAAGGEGSSK